MTVDKLVKAFEILQENKYCPCWHPNKDAITIDIHRRIEISNLDLDEYFHVIAKFEQLRKEVRNQLERLEDFILEFGKE